jgi:predicted aldo/keto reductase-like oxidoreductase
MLYRKLGNTTVKPSVLGFGAMRLPMVGAQGGLAGFDPNIPIDEVEATKMIEHAVEEGVTYFDTAYGYHGGKSEVFLGKALRRHRSKVLIATKLPSWNVVKPEDMEKLLNEQLERLGTDYLDFYLIHGLDSNNWAKMKGMGALEFLDQQRKSGRIRFAGFSFHDEIKVFKNIIDAFDWSMCLLQFNFYDRDYQAGRAGLAYATARGVGIVVMEPLRGGKLVDKIPEKVQTLWDSAPVKRSPVEWAMRYVWDFPEVTTVLTGASTLKQLQDHTRIADQGIAKSLTAEEHALIDKVRKTYRKMLKVDCTGCGYCMPCPNGVNIPQNFTLYNDSYLFTGGEFNAFFYNQFLTPEQRASGCFDCLICVEKCPQKIDIPKVLKYVHEHFGQKQQ